MGSWNPDDWFWNRAMTMFERAGQPRPRARAWEPPADVFETAGELHIELAMPGVPPERVTTAIEGDTLVVTGQRRLPARYRRAHVHRLEIPVGAFERRITLPPGSYEVIEHELNYGCLILTLRKRPGGTR